MKRSYEIDMCNGPLLGKILQFSIPLICSGILQLLFNAADIVVLGQFTGSDALAAVGSTSALNNLIVNVFLGFSIGCSIMTARYYGAQKWKDVHEVVHTSMLVSMICGAALIVVGIALARPLLEVMGTPENVLDQAVLYMRIIFVGMPALMVYNFGAAILRAVGDTKRPLLFLLIATTLINPNALKLMLPKSSNQLKDKAMTTVSIQDAGHGKYRYYVELQEVGSIEGVERALKTRLDGQKDATVSLHCDETVAVGETVKVMNIAKDNNYKLILATAPN